MSRICFKIENCPRRISIGNNSDPDLVTEICPKCKTLIYLSDSRSKRIKKLIKTCFFLTLLIVLSFLVWHIFNKKVSNNSSYDKLEGKTPKNTIKSFFDELNNENYINAYKLTNNTIWGFPDDFKEKLAFWKLIEIKSISGKSYYSNYQPDTIINMKYIGTIDPTLTEQELNYDYLLKQFNGEWKIIRVLNPKIPGVDILKKDEIPKIAEEAVRNFLLYIDQGLYEKAFELTNNPKWGGKKQFISEDKGWGCISDINIYKIAEAENISEQFKIISARYYAKDPCNISNIYEFDFHVKKTNGLWRIIKVLNKKK